VPEETAVAEVTTPDTPTPEVTDPVDDDAYEDVLYAALTKIYKEIDDPDSAPDGEDPPVNEDGTPKAPKRPAEEMSLEELRAAYAKQQNTLKEVVGLSLQEKEERAAVDTWNGFLKEASPVETAIAKEFAFEVEDREGMLKQIKQVKQVAAATERIIGEQVGGRTGGIKNDLRTRYGILTPEPDTTEDLGAQDAKDMKTGDHASIIARRFRNRAR
jgi:hypothetical protein